MDLYEKILAKKANIGIMGLGYVGLPLALEFCKVGFPVTGFDIDEKKISMLKNRQPYIQHISLDPLKNASCNFVPTSNFSLLANMDCIIICVPTPLNQNREPDMKYVFDTTHAIAQHLQKGQLIVLESTTYPGTTDEDMRFILEAKGLKAGEDFYLAFSPEREDPGNKNFNTHTIPKVVGGYSPACLKVANAMYSQVVTKTVPVSSTKVAECAKLLENIYRAVNIALVNELKILFDKMGIDIWEVIEASKTKPFGFQAFYPGPGLGGHCLPIDPFYLTWKAREYDCPTKFIELAGEINTYMPYYVIEKVGEALNERSKSIQGSKMLVLGLSYKPDIDDVRESPAFKVIQLLEKKGATVDYHDPYVASIPDMRHYKLEKRQSIAFTAENLKQYDCVVLVTHHTAYDPEFLVANVPLLVDTRNVTKEMGKNNPKIKKA